MQLILFAAINDEGNIAMYSLEPRYEETLGSFVCPLGEIILKKSKKHIKLVEYIKQHSTPTSAAKIIFSLDDMDGLL